MFYGVTNLDGYVLSGAVCASKSVLDNVCSFREDGLVALMIGVDTA